MQARASQIAYADTHRFSKLFVDYVGDAPQLADFYGPAPTLEGVDAALAARQRVGFGPGPRQALVAALKRQYLAINAWDAVAPQAEALLSASAYTVCTGQQLNVYLGPLYTVLKAATAIVLARAAEARNPGTKIVPIFWLASEDHDLAEVDHLYLQKEWRRWAVPGTGAAGPLATTGVENLLAGLQGPLPDWLTRYPRHATLAQATTWLLHSLFGSQGLLVLDPADRDLKAAFAATMRHELMEGFAAPPIEQTTAGLEKLGYKSQVHPREINLFLLGPGVRERIQRAGQDFSAGSLGRFTRAEMLAMLETEPERFSPNVCMRPLYQEAILPNLAYVGGPAEVAYWLQLGGAFAAAGLAMPVVWPRQSMLYLNARQSQKLARLHLSPADLFLPADALAKKTLALNVGAAPTFDEEQAAFEALMDALKTRALAQDSQLGPSLEADRARLSKRFEPVYRKIIKAWQRRHGDVTCVAARLQAALFPAGGLQERTVSFLEYELAQPGWVASLVDYINPMEEHRFLVLESLEQDD